MIQLFGERVERGRERVWSRLLYQQIQRPLELKGMTTQVFFLICASLYPVLCSPDCSRISGFNGKALFLTLRQGTMGTGLSGA